MPNFGSKPCSRCIARLGSLQRLNMGFGKNNTINAKGKARHPIKRSRTDAGAPVPTPCSPRARRFRRARPLSCTPYRAGASDTATPAGIPAENAMQTDDTTQPMQPQPSEVAPASPPPPLTDSASVALRPAHARQRLRRVAGRWCGRRCRYGARPALRDRAAACVV